MSAIRLRGATSGTTDVVAAAIAGDGVLTLPSGTGTLATQAFVNTAVAAGGKVLQVVTFKSGAINVTTTSSSFVTTGVTISITPQFSDSKILLAFTGHFGQDTGNQAVSVALFRGTVAGTNLGVIAGLQSSAGSNRSMLTQVMFDEPATTAAVTYTLGFVSGGGATARAGIGTIMTMLAIEVAA